MKRKVEIVKAELDGGDKPRKKRVKKEPASSTVKKEKSKSRKNAGNVKVEMKEEDEKEARWKGSDEKRCDWAEKNPDYHQYHDHEWGTPSHDDDHLFEMLCLGGFQCGLSWGIVLRKRPHFREVFDGFKIDKVAKFDQAKIDKILVNPNIIRNKAKVNSVVHNAKLIQGIQKEFGSFDKYVWSFVNNKTVHRDVKSDNDCHSSSPESDAMSAAFKKKGFKFVGSTILHSFMQENGLINDHHVECFKRKMFNC